MSKRTGLGRGIGALIPTAPALLSADVLSAQANVSCSSGVPALSGSSSIAGLKVLGQDVGADGLLNAILPLIDSRSISLADLDLSQLKFYDPTGLVPIALTTLQPVPAVAPAESLTVQLLPLPCVTTMRFVSPGAAVTWMSLVTTLTVEASAAGAAATRSAPVIPSTCNERTRKVPTPCLSTRCTRF